MKHIRTVALLLVLTLCLGSVGCASKTVSALAERIEDLTPEKSGSAPTTVLSDAAPLLTPPADRQVGEAMQILVETAADCARTRDRGRFERLFDGVQAGTVDAWWNNFCTMVDYCGGAEHVETTVIAEADGYYALGFCFYTVTGVHPNARIYRYFGAVLTRYENGEAVFTDQSDEIYRKVRPGMEDALFDALGAEGDSARAAMESGRNFTAFAYNWMFLDPDFSFAGYYNGPEPLYMWQEENGDVKVMLWAANGLDVNMSSYGFTLTVTDSRQGTVFDGTVAVDMPVQAHRNVIRVVTIPASEIRTGTLPWNALQESHRSRF